MEKAKKIVTIIVNGRQNEWTEKEISYAQVVALAFEHPTWRTPTFILSTIPGLRATRRVAWKPVTL